jgi:hypothetical protein
MYKRKHKASCLKLKAQRKAVPLHPLLPHKGAMGAGTGADSHDY